MQTKLSVCVIALAWPASFCFSQCLPTWESTLGGGLSGGVMLTTNAGPIAVVGRVAALDVLNLADPSHPTLLATLSLPGAVVDLGAFGGVAVVACAGNRLCTVDLSNPARPYLVGQLVAAGPVSQLVVKGRRAYAALGAPGLSVIDFSNPAQPTPTQSIDLPGNVTQVAQSGDHIIITEGGFGLRLYDADPAGQLVEVGGLRSAPPAASMSGDNNTLFLASSPSTVVALDIRNPSAITERWRLPFPGAANRLRLHGTNLFVNCGVVAGMAVVDVADPAFPRVVSTTQVGENALWIDAKENMLLLVGSQSGASVVSTTDLSRLRALGRYDPLSFPEQVALRGNYAFIAGGSGGRLDIVDISDLARPRIVNYIDTFGLLFGVTLSGDVAWAVDAGLLLRVDISSLPAVRITDLGLTPDGGYRAAVSGDAVYVAVSTAGVAVYNSLADPITVLDTPIDARDVAVDGTALLVADSGGGAIVVDISNSAAPAITGTFNASGSTFNVSIVVRNGIRYGYATSTLGGMQILDLTDVQHPVRLGTIPAQERYYGMAVLDNRMYIAENGRGVRVLDLTDPAAPVPISVIDTPGLARGVAVDASHLVVADFTGGARFAPREGRAPTILEQPITTRSCRGSGVDFFATASGEASTTYQWRKDGSPIPATFSSLHFSRPTPADVGVYDCVISNVCGEVQSHAAQLLLCVADVDDGSGSGSCDGAVNVDDLLWYLDQFESGSSVADIDDGLGLGEPDGGVTIDDLLYYLARFDAGC